MAWFNAVVLKRVASLRPRIVYCHDVDTLPAGLACQLLFGSAVIYDSHEYWPDKTHIGQLVKLRSTTFSLIEWVALRRVDAMIVVSDTIADLYRARFRKTPAVSVVRNIPTSVAKVEAVGQPGRRLAMVGAITQFRGIELAVDSLTLLPEATLMVVGPCSNPSYREGLIEKIRILGIEDRVSLRDPVDPSELLDFLVQNADISLILIEGVSTSYQNALPNKFFESIAAGVPVVVSNLPQLAEITDKYRCGLVLRESSPTALAEHIVSAFDDLQALRHGVAVAQRDLDGEGDRTDLATLISDLAIEEKVS